MCNTLKPFDKQYYDSTDMNNYSNFHINSKSCSKVESSCLKENKLESDINNNINN